MRSLFLSGLPDSPMPTSSQKPCNCFLRKPSILLFCVPLSDFTVLIFNLKVSTRSFVCCTSISLCLLTCTLMSSTCNRIVTSAHNAKYVVVATYVTVHNTDHCESWRIASKVCSDSDTVSSNLSYFCCAKEKVSWEGTAPNHKKLHSPKCFC